MSEKKTRTITGRVVSAKNQNTVTVSVERLVAHAIYGKITRKTTKYRAHDDACLAAEGDLVELVPSRPTSKSKSWQVQKVLEKAAV